MKDNLLQPDEAAQQGTAGTVEEINTTFFVPLVSGPTTASDETAVGRECDAVERPLFTSADGRAQGGKEFTARRLPDPGRLIFAGGDKIASGGITGDSFNCRSMSADFEAQNRLGRGLGSQNARRGTEERGTENQTQWTETGREGAHGVESLKGPGKVDKTGYLRVETMWSRILMVFSCYSPRWG